MSPTTKISASTRRPQFLVDHDAAGTIGGNAQPFRRRRSLHAGGPDDRAAWDEGFSDRYAFLGAGCNRLAGADFDAQLFQCLVSVGGQPLVEAWKYARSGLDKNDLGLGSIDIAELLREGRSGQLGDDAGKLDAGRSSADDREGQQSVADRGIAFQLGLLEGQQNAAADRRCVLQRLQPRRHRFPFVMPEIGMRRTGGQHQRVICYRLAALQCHHMCLAVDADDLRQQRRYLRPIAEKASDRPSDLGRGEQGGRNLIEQGLEQMMVTPVDQRDANRSSLEIVDELQAAKTAPDDNNVMILHDDTPVSVLPPQT